MQYFDSIRKFGILNFGRCASSASSFSRSILPSANVKGNLQSSSPVLRAAARWLRPSWTPCLRMHRRRALGLSATARELPTGKPMFGWPICKRCIVEWENCQRRFEMSSRSFALMEDAGKWSAHFFSATGARRLPGPM